MSRLSLYVLRQLVGPTALFAFLLTCVILLSQSLYLLNVVINGGQSAATFLYLTMLLLPQLLVIILPIAFFVGALFALSRLNSDSELVVMSAAGHSKEQLAVPVFAAAGLIIALTYVLGLYLMPLGQRTLNDVTGEIRADVGAALLNEGEFKTPTKGVTVFIRSMRGGGGDIRGILVHDSRDPKRPVTYIAERGLLARTPDGARLIMFNYTLQVSEQGGKKLTVGGAERATLDMDQFTSANRIMFRRPNERFLGELIWPSGPGVTEELRRTYLAEANNRLSQPLYCLAFALIVLAAVTRGRRARGANALRLSIASLSAAGLRIVGYGVAPLAAKQPWLNILFYLVPLAGIGLAYAFFQGFDPMKYLKPRDMAPLENAP
jgi:lipopolysaccharide export system permease protein